MKRFLLLAIMLLSFSFSYSSSSYTAEKGIVQSLLEKTGIKKDRSKDFKVDDIKVFTEKKDYRRINIDIKNVGSENYESVTFSILLGKTEESMSEVYTFTIYDFDSGKKYKFDSKVYVGDVRGRNAEVRFIGGKAE
ncbi:hypothetical protein [Ilyobacter polytropus]|uniref:CARDB domain-containing protein n=1 Tax=Ilyobacter polytropus (strain ATCC 51220 / DSM 2926 / LMG 16218 / CuHBu1) TaxID=572544 RepID=E3H7R6_ILYPC|nr:hypothetical protein [Ilyobacter polytropus]ADO82648.1 hypothetical protein Ilyop_0862 [Ilyobacter polytropus DSM 2926]